VESNKVLQLREQAAVVVGHDHTMTGIAARRRRGERAVFSRHYAALFRKGGVNLVGLVVGGDFAHSVTGVSDPWWSSLFLVDMLWQEAEESRDTLAVCLNCQDIDAAIAERKIGVLVMMEGAKPVVEGPVAESLTNLRMLYRLGLRGLQFFGNGWNRLASEPGETGICKGLSPLGIEVVREMNRLGMVIDLAHISDPTPLFWDIIERSEDPIIDSHHNVRAANNVQDSLDDEQIRAIAQKGGVIGLLFTSQWINKAVARATVDDLIRHIDHIVELVGIDHVGIGPDLVDRDVKGLGPDYFILDSIEQLDRMSDGLAKHGYSDADIYKVLGENFLRIYRQVIG
jgi:membrane dipeptidase